jgi:hypothetical protein
MESGSTSDDYQKLVGKLIGQAFEDEVCARLQSVFVDFQRIPAKPQGDGGLDGLSHGQDRAYCCYGPEQEARKLENQGLKDDIIEKFAADLRKLFELKLERRKLRHTPNNELASIMGEGRRIKNIFLIVSWFESHRVIGPLNTRFDKYKASSQLQFIDKAATLTVWGPKDLSTLGAVDEHTLFRIQNPSLIASVQTASAARLVNGSGDFDAKFDDLKRRRPGLSSSIDGIAQKLREAWAAAIALDNDLSKNSVGLHQTLESVRSNAALSAQVKSMGAPDPYHLIDKMREEVTDEIEKGFGNRFGPLTSRISQGVVAGLVGECPIEWRDNNA